MVFGRLGGEEFGLFLTDIDEAAALDFLETQRIGVEGLEIRFNGNVLKITTSMGVASADETGYDLAVSHPAIKAWLGRMAQLPGWKSAYDLLPGERLTHYAK